ncbi:zinc finger protein 704 isoform X1 [Alosa sapidissima]|uniref:zinc finger protein 704 isoform X1 n=1 Tax=Alosa sapidissima TaxID=34773 RepID=UPI001C09907C|nr:zinc finger protein 704 isoform X1 [Alosa sapidissima]
MTSKRLLDKPLAGIRLGGAASSRAGNSTYGGNTAGHAETVTAMDCGVILACKNVSSPGRVFSPMLDNSTLKECISKDSVVNGVGLKSGREKHLDLKKVGCPGNMDESDLMGPCGVLKNPSPTHRLILNGQKLDDQMHFEPRPSGRESGEARSRLQPLLCPDGSPEERPPHASSHIPVPRNRNPSGHADKEVMAATVLTSLSTSPLVLNPPSAAPAAVPELSSRGWKESLSASYSSSTSGNWSWDTSDQSVPSTPSPPLSNDAGKGFLLSAQGDDAGEEHDSPHFMFEDPIPRKRKNSMKVMFKCLWKNCEKVLSTSSGIQRHIRTVHLGRNSDSDYSDGEEDFYYTEIEVNMDTLSEGLSSLTPTSPTTAGPPPIFPPPVTSDLLLLPRCDSAHHHQAFHTPLSQSAPSALCHIRTDHAYQATAPVNIPISSETIESENGISVSWQSPPVIFKGLPGPMSHIRTVSIGEKRQLTAAHTTLNNKAHPTTPTPTPKPASGTRCPPAHSWFLTTHPRKPRGEAKKCRKVYGMEKRDLWCTACRWKKACQRFID